MNKVIKTLVLFFGLISPLVMSAQNEVEMADTFRADGKIYVVIAVALLVLTGLVVYLLATDRKLKKLEEEIEGRS